MKWLIMWSLLVFRVEIFNNSFHFNAMVLRNEVLNATYIYFL